MTSVRRTEADRGGPREEMSFGRAIFPRASHACTTEAWPRASHLPSGEPCFYNRSMASGEPSSTRVAAMFPPSASTRVAADRGGPRGELTLTSHGFGQLPWTEGEADREGAAGIGGAAKRLVDLEKQAGAVMRTLNQPSPPLYRIQLSAAGRP